MKRFTALFSAAILIAASSVATAQETAEKVFASYGVGVGYSPFGPSLNLTYNFDAKNTISIGIGGAPEANVPDGLLPNFDPLLLSNAAVSGSSSWMGLFWRHRPFENQNIGFNVGLASGQIENNLTADGFHDDETVSFSVNYTEELMFWIFNDLLSVPVVTQLVMKSICAVPYYLVKDRRHFVGVGLFVYVSICSCICECWCVCMYTWVYT